MAKNKKIKVRQVYTVTRDFTILDTELAEELDSFAGMQDEVGEWLYGGESADEKIEFGLLISRDGGETWEKG